MDRRSGVNDFHTFVGTLFFGLFALVLASARSISGDVLALEGRVLVSAALLVISLYILESGRRAADAARAELRPVRVVQPVVTRGGTRGSRVA